MSDYDQLFCIKLAKAVKKHPCLYNYNLPNYSSKAALDAAWVVVAKEVGTTVPKCKDKWRNIRTVFSRNLRRGRAGDQKRRPYYLKGLLQFLIPFVKTSRSGSNKTSNVEALENIETESNNDVIEIKSETLDEDGTCEVDPQPPVATTESYSSIQYIPTSSLMTTDALSDVLSKNNASEYNYIPNNEVEEKIYSTRKMFLLSLLPDVASMTASQFRKFRLMALSSVDRSLSCSAETHERRRSDFNIGMDAHSQFVRQMQEPSADSSGEIVKTEPVVQESPLPVAESVVSIDTSRVDRINKNDACSYFGKYIAEEIRPLPIQRRMLVQKEIHESISAALIDMNTQINNNDHSVV
ncbi:uncharacterized protein LOC123315378 [Coccinella septempunctata]|uniref:uncharacterized protein LOC123315378 n=1 Tax=Coccinella septempunctata TaxID=41139 RepID=UPI001D08DF1D|nr:uncharacterized protein LOC123315378 [Coccinella septempunctata]